jgi:hypothetical protein
METIEHIEFDIKKAKVGDRYRHLVWKPIPRYLSSVGVAARTLYEICDAVVSQVNGEKIAVIIDGCEYGVCRTCCDYIDQYIPPPMTLEDTNLYNEWVGLYNLAEAKDKSRAEKIKAVDFSTLSKYDLDRICSILIDAGKIDD